MHLNAIPNQMYRKLQNCNLPIILKKNYVLRSSQWST